MSRDHFAHKAAEYDANTGHVDNVGRIADAVLAAVPLAPSMHLMDFGSGTGLLLARLAPHVARITAVDVSASMNAQLEAKRAQLPCVVHVVQADLEREALPGAFDGIVSSMTLHHIRDVPALLGRLRACLVPGGFLAVADLDTEDGTFHAEDTGVHHFGFDREALVARARRAGFDDVRIGDASVVHKGERAYPIFLLTARRPA